MIRPRLPLALLLAAPHLMTAQQQQQQPSLDQVLERLTRLESENRTLRAELEGLRSAVSALRPAVPAASAVAAAGEAGTPAPGVQQLDERLAIQERRTEEQAQIKVEASQRFPIRLSGVLVANLFHNGRGVGGVDTPTTVARTEGRQTGGITFRQSIVGMEYTGAKTFLGATARGSLFADFFEGQTENNNFYPVRIRTGGIHLDWATRSLSIVQEKPLFSQRDPDTFSYAGVSPLTAAGNLWRWQPQIRFEQRAGPHLRAQMALVQTSEDSAFDFAGSRLANERRRPGLQGRVELAAGDTDGARIEIAPGFHLSESNVSGRRYGSNLVSLDWLIAPHPKLRWTGLAWTGQNVHHFGSYRQSFSVINGVVRVVRSRGGWTQLSVPFTARFSVNAYGGIHDDRNADLGANAIGANRSGAVNFMYRMAPNVIISLEGMKQRTSYRDAGNRSNNRYDLSIAYLF